MQRQHDRRYNRRQMLKAATGTLAAASCVPSSALGLDGAVAPSSRVAVGFIGVGMMGQGHLRHLSQYADAQVLAVCDVDRWRRENAKKAVESTYAATRPGETQGDCDAYNDLRHLLDRKDIDAVVIATGDNWHATASVMAAQAGKDIYCEKPISKTIHEARAMVDAARRYERVFQIGLQQRSTPEFRKACALVRRGSIGEVKMVYVGFPGTNSEVNLPREPVPDGLDWNQWLGPAPWRPFNRRYHTYGRPPHVVPWHFCRDFGGGNLTSNTVHSFDIVQWGLGMDNSGPIEIIPPETGEVSSLTYRYPNDVPLMVVDWHLDPARHIVPDGWDVATRLQNFGALFVGQKGWIHVGRQGYLESFPKEILDQAPERPDEFNPVDNHHQNWLDCIRTRERPACDVEFGCRSTTVSHLGCIAHWTGRTQRWNPATEQFIDDEQANRLRWRPMRQPWRV